VSIVLGIGLCLKRFLKFSPRQPGVAARNRHLHTDSKNDSTGHLRRQSKRAPACVVATSTTLASDSSYPGFEVSRHFDGGSVLDTQVDVTSSLCPALNANNMETLQQFTLVLARSESDSFRLFFRQYYPPIYENADLRVPICNTILASVPPLSQVRGFLAECKHRADPGVAHQCRNGGSSWMRVGIGGDSVAETATRLLGAHGIYKGEVGEMENENPSPHSTFNVSEILYTVPLHLQQQALTIQSRWRP
jgi:hypothetical protein